MRVSGSRRQTTPSICFRDSGVGLYFGSRQREATPLGRGAEPQDVCDAVRYLLDADAVTGQMLAVDGGQHLIWQTPDVQGSE